MYLHSIHIYIFPYLFFHIFLIYIIFLVAIFLSQAVDKHNYTYTS